MFRLKVFSNVTPEQPKEFRLKRGENILNYIRKFSATEKGIFLLLIGIVFVTSIIMAFKANNLFMIEIPGKGGVIYEGEVGLPHNINPVLATTDVDRDLVSLIYSGLTKYADGEIVPDIAKSYKISPDGLTYTFTLRDNVKFSDGTILTAEDVIFTIEKIQDSTLKSPRKADWMDVKAKLISNNVIEFTLKQPYSPFLTITTVGIIPKHIWGLLNNDQFVLSQYNIEPVGSGPYMLDSTSRDQGGIPTEYKLSTWRNYYGDTPNIDTIIFRFYSDEEKALAALDSGDIDSLPSVSAIEAARLSSDSAQSYEIITSPLPRIFGVFFNQAQSPALADLAVRKALNISIDRDIIVKKALYGFGIPVTDPFPIGMTSTSSIKGINTNISGFLNTESDATTTSQNIKSAQTVLERNGWKKDTASGIYTAKKNGKNISLSFDLYTADTPELKTAAETIKNTWKALGAEVNIKIFETSDLYQNIIRTRKYDALLFGEFIGKDRDLYAFWHSSQRNSPGLNIAMYANSKTDKLLEDIRSSSDAKVRSSKYEDFAEIIKTDIPAVFLYVPTFNYAIPKNLNNIDLSSITLPSDRFNSVIDWYNRTEKVWKIFSKNY